MHNFFLLLNRYRSFLLFLFLEVMSVWMLFSKEPYQGGKFFNFTNEISGRVHEFASSVSYYLNLKTVNDSLLIENSRLMVTNFSFVLNDTVPDSLLKNFSKENRYHIYPARVVNNTVFYPDNYITINKGHTQGIKPGMGIFTHKAIIGIITQVSDNFAVAVSMLNTKTLLSAKIKKNNASGTLSWDGTDPTTVYLKFIPKHIRILRGDSVVSSDYSSIFPGNIPVGEIEEINLKPGDNFYTLTVKLFTDFNNLRYVYVVQNKAEGEQHELEKDLRSGK